MLFFFNFLKRSLVALTKFNMLAELSARSKHETIQIIESYYKTVYNQLQKYLNLRENYGSLQKIG